MKLKVGDRVISEFKNSTYGKEGIIIGVEKDKRSFDYLVYTVEFINEVVNGHDGSGYAKGKLGHCWNLMTGLKKKYRWIEL